MHGAAGVLALMGAVVAAVAAGLAALGALTDDPAAFALGGGIIGTAVWLLVRTTTRQEKGWTEALETWERIAKSERAENLRMLGAIRERDAMIRERDEQIRAKDQRIAALEERARGAEGRNLNLDPGGDLL